MQRISSHYLFCSQLCCHVYSVSPLALLSSNTVCDMRRLRQPGAVLELLKHCRMQLDRVESPEIDFSRISISKRSVVYFDSVRRFLYPKSLSSDLISTIFQSLIHLQILLLFFKFESSLKEATFHNFVFNYMTVQFTCTQWHMQKDCRQLAASQSILSGQNLSAQPLPVRII